MISGLSPEEVKLRIAEGKVNKSTEKKTKLSTIIKRHTLTFFNIIIFALALVVLFFGERTDILFIVIAVAATLIAIINDIRAKISLEKLNLLSEKSITVIRNGKEKRIKTENVVENDILRFSLGDQIIVDSEIKQGEIEVNESFITGESDNIKKRPGDELTSGSFVVSGSCLAEAKKVGDESFISKLMKNAKTIKSEKSELFSTIQQIIKINSIVLIPIGIALFFKQLSLEEATVKSAITSTVAALVSMIPEGLVLLTSSVLALATIRLSKKKIIVNDFYSIETLARVDTICLDKTGTLTTGKMTVEKIVELDGKAEEVEEIIKLSNTFLGGFNPTSHALLTHFGKFSEREIKKLSENSKGIFKKFGQNSKQKPDELYEFSSDKKYSGFRIGNTEYIVGAYSFISNQKTHKKEEENLSKNYRVLTVLKREKNREESEKILGFVLLSDEIRKNAKEIIGFYQQNDVKIKIISGDNLGTISHVLKSLDLNLGNSVDLSTIESHKSYKSLAENFDVFARVRPEEKKELIKALKASGHTVAMTGDGVNDVLALKEASCGISIGEGADAARRAADIVLLDNDFSALPSAIFEGRQTINNVSRSSALFLNKTIFATILSIIYIFINFRYPFTPLEMSYINALIIGIPSFLLALETNHERQKTNFAFHIMKNSLPAALATIFAIIAVSIISDVLYLTWEETTTLSCLATCLIGFLLIFRVSYPMNKFRLSIVVPLIVIIFITFATPAAEGLLRLANIDLTQILTFLAISAASTMIYCFSIFLTDKIEQRLEKRIQKN